MIDALWYILFLIAGFVIGSLAGAGLSWLYVVMTIFKQLRRIFESITTTEKKEEEELDSKVIKIDGKDGRDTKKSDRG